MAFEIYNGTVNDPNTIIDKLIEMWEFDSTDQTGNNHSATWGNYKVYRSSNNVCIGDGNQAPFQVPVSSSPFRIIKTPKAIMATWSYNNLWKTVIIGNIYKANGTQSKGIIGCESNSLSAAFDRDLLANFSYTALRTNNDIQLIPHVAQNDYYMDQVYRIVACNFQTIGAISGKYKIGDDLYYISNLLALKDN